MIIKLTDSKLFTTHPAERFAQEYDVTRDIFDELWKRHKLLEYDLPALCGYLQYKTGIKSNPTTIWRWMRRGEIYIMAHAVTTMGVRVVDSSYFKSLEEEVLKEILKNIKYNGNEDSRSLV